MFVIEGKAKIVVENAFYNPRMRFCRDLDMLVFSVMGRHKILDALSATGVRGIRAILEADCEASFNDVNPKAVKTIKKNLEMNGIEAEIFCMDASILSRMKKFEHVDIDPFGSPANFIESACTHTKFLSVTATDLEALCCKSSAGLRKYSAFVLKTDVPHEIGLRTLLGFIARTALRFDKAVYPLICWVKEHYYRVHVVMKKSSSEVMKTIEKIGYIAFCKTCFSKKILKFGDNAEICHCGDKMVLIGPLWLGELKDVDFIQKMIQRSERKIRDFLLKIQKEIDYPLAYSLPKICSHISKPVPSTSKFVEKLKENGFIASSVHYCGYFVKTDADIKEIIKVLST
ncbi:MAG: tRNA (guanine(10)-N(2))-dimethyltransferase [Archaeoglobaceae archaeon]|nr:tRNA (guanine(10)-N(2))-dimethyltransferase [Archaeoglobaceae archaeon]MDW7989427.1 tRNA (guanine(10)-N(2))-dimethyltransferase [Archaeoglobaceae archaeon]